MGSGLRRQRPEKEEWSALPLHTVEGLLYVMLGRPEYCDLSRKIFLDTPCTQGKQEDSYYL